MNGGILHQAKVVLIGLLLGLPLAVVWLWVMLLSFVFRMRPRWELYAAQDMRVSSGIRVVVNRCGCRHVELMFVRKGSLYVGKFHFGRCRHGEEENAPAVAIPGD